MGNPVVHSAQGECKRGHALTEENVRLHRNTHGGLSRVCETCRRSLTRARLLRQKYGISVQEFEVMLLAQGNRCAVCGGEFTEWDPTEPGVQLAAPVVDHSHSTGKVRGLLCRGCNVAMGHFGDDPEQLRRAADYIEAAERSA